MPNLRRVYKILPSQNFYVRSDYKIRKHPEYFPDEDSGVIWQPQVYDFAFYLGKVIGVEYIIDIGVGSGKKLQKFTDYFKIIGVDFGTNIKLFRENLPHQKIIKSNLEKGLPNIEKRVLEKSIIICADVVEHLKNPHRLLEQLAVLSKICPFVLISTPDRIKYYGDMHLGPSPNLAHVREWSLREFKNLLKSYKFAIFLTRYTQDSDKYARYFTILVLSGYLSASWYFKKLFYCQLQRNKAAKGMNKAQELITMFFLKWKYRVNHLKSRFI